MQYIMQWMKLWPVDLPINFPLSWLNFYLEIINETPVSSKRGSLITWNQCIRVDSVKYSCCTLWWLFYAELHFRTWANMVFFLYSANMAGLPCSVVNWFVRLLIPKNCDTTAVADCWTKNCIEFCLFLTEIIR